MITNEKKIEMYKRMLTIRRFEETIRDLYRDNQIKGALHLYIGEEAVAVGACSTLSKEDYIYSTHRGHGHCIAKGADVKRVMAELFAKSTGVCKGKGGSMHVADISVGSMGASGIVGGSIPLATGAGLSIKYRGSNQVSIGFFGDGASNQGTFHESLNLAAIWSLPVIYICENNQYAESTHIGAATKINNIADRAVAYGIPGVTIDGMDVEVVFNTVFDGVKRARSGEGPTLIECKTYRFESHEEGDPQHTYRAKEEVEKWREKCPIKNYRKKLIEEKVLSETKAGIIDTEIDEMIENAVKYAKESPDPLGEDALKDVFVSSYY